MQRCREDCNQRVVGCSSGSDGAKAQITTDWLAKCVNEAVGICKRNIANVASDWCPSKNMNGGQLNGMKAQCQAEVDSMVGNNNRRPPTRSPTHKPSKANKRPPTRSQ